MDLTPYCERHIHCHQNGWHGFPMRWFSRPKFVHFKVEIQEDSPIRERGHATSQTDFRASTEL